MAVRRPLLYHPFHQHGSDPGLWSNTWGGNRDGRPRQALLITLLIIIFLVAMWAAVLAAPLLQSRGQQQFRGGDSIKTFQRQLATLDRRGGDFLGGSLTGARPASLTQQMRAPQVRRASASQLAAQRRRRVFTLLTSTAVLSLALAFLLDGPFVWVHLLVDGLLAAYVVLVFHTMRTHAEREMNVAFLPHAETMVEPVVMLREVAQRR